MKEYRKIKRKNAISRANLLFVCYISTPTRFGPNMVVLKMSKSKRKEKCT